MTTLPFVSFVHADTSNPITGVRFPTALSVGQKIVVLGRRYIVVALGAVNNARQTATIRPWSPTK